MQKKINLNSITEIKNKRYAVNDVISKKLLSNKLISCQYHSLSKPLAMREEEIRKQMNFYQYKFKNAKDLANIYHNGIIFFTALGNYKYARETCYTQIQFFIRLSHKLNDNQIKKFIFQPWLHLVRLERLQGSIHEGLKKLDILTDANPKLNLGENKLLRQSLYEALFQDSMLHRDIMTQSLLERIKINFLQNQYDKILDFIQSKKIFVTKYTNIFIQEACAIMYANTGKIHEAFAILANNKISFDPFASRVLLLRECEIHASLGGNKKVYTEIDNLYQYCLKQIRSTQVSVNDIIFTLHLVRVMKSLEVTQNILQLTYFCLEASDYLDDDLLKAECLATLYDLNINVNARILVEDFMIEHYHKTQYIKARRIMLNSFGDLQHVEKSKCISAHALYEDIMVLDAFK